MKEILTAFLTLCLIPLYLHPAEKEKKEEEKSYLDRLKKAYDEKVESGKKLYDEESWKRQRDKCPDQGVVNEGFREYGRLGV